MLRRKLEMSGVDLDIIIPSSDVNAEADAGMGNSRDEDMMPTPEAVKLMARQMESINAPMAKKNAPAVSVSSTRSGSREGLLSPAVSRKHSSNSTSKKEAPQTANSSPAARIAVSNNGDGNEEYEDDAYADEDFEEDVRSKPGTAHRPEHPAPKIMLVTEISRRFDQGDLLVPDLEELTKNSTTEAEKLAHAPSNISINSQPDEEFDVTTKSNSMRHSGAAAVHQALSFVADEQPDFLGKISAGPSFTNDVDPPPPTSAVQKVADPEATQENEDPYAEDTYDDDFIDADADAEPTSVRVKSAAMAISEVSPAPISTTSLQSSPATLQPLTSSKYDREDDDEVRISSSASPMPSRAPVLVPSGEASPVKSTAVVAASTTAKTQDKEKEEDAYEEDNYEDEFDADEGEASSPAKAASMKASPVPSPKVASSYQPLQKQEIEVSNDNDADFDELSYQLSSKKVAADQEEAVSAAALPAAAAAESYKTPITTSSYTAPADEDDYELDPTPVASMKVKTDSPVRESVASVSEPTPSAPAPSSVAIDIVSATVVSPPMQSEPRAQSAPGDDEYAADEFDDYDVSFGEQDP